MLGAPSDRTRRKKQLKQLRLNREPHLALAGTENLKSREVSKREWWG